MLELMVLASGVQSCWRYANAIVGRSASRDGILLP